MSMVEAVKRELAKLPDDLSESIEAATILTMAERVDAGKGSPSECGKVILDAIKTLRGLIPPKQEKDDLDELAERRRRRLADRSAKAQDLPRS